MARYRFTEPYASHIGSWETGEVAEFDNDTAEWLQRDAPGCIEPEPSRAIDKAPNDRQIKGPTQKRGA